MVSWMTAMPSLYSKVCASAAMAGSSAARGGVNVLCAHSHGQHLGGRVLCDLRRRRRVENEPLEGVEVRERQEHVPVREHQAGGAKFASPAAQRAAKASATLSPRSCATMAPASAPSDLGQVVADELRVSLERVALALRLVGEPESREVEDADAMRTAETAGDVGPVDACRGEPMERAAGWGPRDRRARHGRCEASSARRAAAPAAPTRRSLRRRATPWRARPARG